MKEAKRAKEKSEKRYVFWNKSRLNGYLIIFISLNIIYYMFYAIFKGGNFRVLPIITFLLVLLLILEASFEIFTIDGNRLRKGKLSRESIALANVSHLEEKERLFINTVKNGRKKRIDVNILDAENNLEEYKYFFKDIKDEIGKHSSEVFDKDAKDIINDVEEYKTNSLKKRNKRGDIKIGLLLSFMVFLDCVLIYLFINVILATLIIRHFGNPWLLTYTIFSLILCIYILIAIFLRKKNISKGVSWFLIFTLSNYLALRLLELNSWITKGIEPSDAGPFSGIIGLIFLTVASVILILIVKEFFISTKRAKVTFTE